MPGGGGPMRVTVRKEGWRAAVFEHGRAPVYHNGVLGRQVATVVGRRAGLPTPGCPPAQWLAGMAGVAGDLAKAGFLVVPTGAV